MARLKRFSQTQLKRVIQLTSAVAGRLSVTHLFEKRNTQPRIPYLSVGLDFRRLIRLDDKVEGVGLNVAAVPNLVLHPVLPDAVVVLVALGHVGCTVHLVANARLNSLPSINKTELFCGFIF